MRKNLFGFVIVAMVAVVLSGCENTESKVNQVIQNQMQEADKKNSQSESTETNEEEKQFDTAEKQQNEATFDKPKESTADCNVDVDLTKLSSTMVYSEVYNMMYMPQDYVGKTVRMNGMFVAYTNQDQSQFYPAVIVADATACCSQGLEFLLEGNPPFPEGYPEMETEITVIGTFETYDEDGNMYCRLKNAKIE